MSIPWWSSTIFLHVAYPGFWFGKGGPTAWPPRSPDLNPLDFHLRDHMNCLVYKDNINNRDALVRRTLVAAERTREVLGPQFTATTNYVVHRC